MLGVNFALNNMFINQREEILLEKSKNFQLIFDDAAETGIVDVSRIKAEINSLESYLGAKVIIADKEGKGIESDNIVGQIIGESNLTNKDVVSIFQGKTVKIRGYIKSLSKDQIIIIGTPLFFEGKPTHALLLTASIPEVRKAHQSINIIVLLSLMVSAIVASLLILQFTRRMNKQIKDLNQAAKYLAKGNFDKLIRVDRADELGELIENFNHMAEELKASELTKRNFISNLSHDLRSPLQSITGYTQAILDGTIDSTRQARYLNIVLDESERLTKLVNDILDLSKMQSGHIDISKKDFHVNQLLVHELDKFEARIIEKNIRLEIELEDTKVLAHADEEAMKRVVYNLIDNAVKFVEVGGTIEIRSELKADRFLIGVRNSSPFLSEAETAVIWNRFMKLDTSRGEVKSSSGLGLAIVKELIKAQDEKIEVYSNANIGVMFVFSITTQYFQA
jgi:signal transduction histidine kinase